MLDKTFYGRVIKVDIATSVGSTSAAKPTYETLYYKNTVYLTIETATGKTIKRKAYEGKANPKTDNKLYNIGDVVFHLFGTKHIIVVPEGSDNNVRCAVCGEVNDKSLTTCKNCTHTLIKSCNKY